MEKKRLLNHVKPSGRSLSLLVTLLALLPQSMWAQTDYGLSVGGVAVTSENAEAITGDNISGTISFDPSTNKLTLDNASVNGFADSNGCIVSRLSDLTIVIKGNNKLECSKDSCTAIRSEAVATLTIEKGEDECSLYFSGSRAIRDFKTLTLTGIHWDWGNNYTYDVGNFGYGEGYGLLDVKGEEAGDVRLSDDALDPPSMFVEENQMIGFEYDDVSKVFYSIDYVDSSLEDIEETELNVQEPYVTLEGPCTVTAYAQNGDFKSATITGKLFGFASTVTVKNQQIDNQTVDLPSIVPAIGDGLSIQDVSISTNETAAPAYIGQNKEIVVSNDVLSGTCTVTAYLNTIVGADAELSYTILNREDYSRGGYPLQFTLEVQAPTTYGIVVNGTTINENNRANVLGDVTKSVRFDGNKTLILDHAALTSIETSLSEGGELKVFLIGENTVTHIMDTGQQMPKLTIETAYNNPGKLTLGEYGNGVVTGFNSVDIVQPLAILIPEGAESLIGTEAAISNATIGAPLNLIIDNVTETTQGVETNLDYSNPTGENAAVVSSPLTNTIINNVLYTLHDTQTADAADDGYDTKTKQIVLNSNSVMTDKDVAAVNLSVETGLLLPGTNAYAEQYNGLTFMVPAGTGKITLDTNTAPDREFHLTVGAQDPVTVINKVDNNNTAFSIDYAVSKSTYVYLYLTAKAASSRGSHRIGPKSGIGGGLGSLKVSSSEGDIATPAVVPSSYKMCTADMVSYGATGGITVDDASVTDIDATAFIKGGSAASRRALYENVPFIDLTKTCIVGKDVSRKSGAFEGFPGSTLIYLPAGNTSSESNVIIGKVCEKMVLNGADDNTKAFELIDNVKEFTAANAKLERTFGKVSSTVYLPFGISNPADYGEFWTISAVDTENLDVTLSKAATVEANTAYVFIPKDGVSELEVKNTTVKKLSVPSDAKLQGTFEVKDYEDGMYCYAGDDEGDDIKTGDFVKMGPGSKVPPFRAFFKTTSAASRFAIIWDGDGTTGLRSVLTDGFEGQNIWYDLSGRRIDKPATKGIFIHNGKKYINK